MKKTPNPIVQVLLLLIFIALILCALSAFAISYFPNGDFKEISNDYLLELQLAFFLSNLSAMVIIYFYLYFRIKKNAPVLNESDSTIHWIFEKSYWLKFKRRELQKKVSLNLLKIIAISLPASILLFFIYKENALLFFISLIFILIFTIPILTIFTITFVRDLNNQLFQKRYEVKIYKKGLAINERYYAFNYYQDTENNLQLIDIKKCKISQVEGLKFISRRQYFVPGSQDGGDSGFAIRKTVSISIPLPENDTFDLNKLKKILKINL